MAAYIRNYTVASGDVIIAIVGITSGEIAIIGETLDGANLTENCVKLTNYNGITAEYLYCYWQYLRKNGGIDPLLVGAAQPKLPMYNIQSVPVIIPDDATMDNYHLSVASRQSYPLLPDSFQLFRAVSPSAAQVLLTYIYRPMKYHL